MSATSSFHPLNPDFLAAMAAVRGSEHGSRAWALVQHALPPNVKAWALACIAPKAGAGPRYPTRQQLNDLRRAYAVARAATGPVAFDSEMDAATIDPRSVNAIRAATLSADAERRRTDAADGAKTFDRSHHLRDFASAVTGMASSIAAHGRDLEQRDSQTAAERKSQWSRISLDRYSKPHKKIATLAHESVWRWLRAIQCTNHRLPPSERQAAADHAQARLRDFHARLALLHTLARTPADEYRRWHNYGFGAADMAVIYTAGMVQYARELAGRMVVDDDCADSIRRVADEVWAATTEALATLAEGRFDTLLDRTWHRRNRAALLEFGQLAGGVGPDLEVLFHARGSEFVAYH